MNKNAGRVLIIGASRGIGLGLVTEYLQRGWEVIATVRGPSTSIEELKGKHPAGALRIEMLDIDDHDQLLALRDQIGNDQLDLFFVSAGTTNWPDKPASQVKQSEIDRVMNTNAFSPIRVADTLFDLIAADGTIVFMSSIFASIALNNGHTEVYRASKAALNMLVSCFALRHPTPARPILLLHPGWVQTDMGGPHAAIDVKTSANGLVDTIAGRKGIAGLAFIDFKGKELPW